LEEEIDWVSTTTLWCRASSLTSWPFPSFLAPSVDRPREDGMGFEEAMDAIARGVEVIGIMTLVVGLAAALVRAGLALFGGQGAEQVYRIVRTVFGRSILLGLEFLVAADIIRTVAVEPSLQNVTVLGLIVLIRTFLSFSLEVEIDGRWPWRRAVLGQAASSPESPRSSGPWPGTTPDG
jgi:uncharacterized membrane protein